MTFEERFKVFAEHLNKTSPTPITDDLMTLIKSAMVAAKFDHLTECKKKKMTGYNYFMKEKMKEQTGGDKDSNRRMLEISECWGKLTGDEKLSWKTKANEFVVMSNDESTGKEHKIKERKKPQFLSGYQLFVREHMKDVKSDVPQKDRMREVGKMWHSVTKEEQIEYKTRAKSIPLTHESQ